MEDKKDKSLVEYKESRNFFKWIKSKINDIFNRNKKVDIASTKASNGELSTTELDEIHAGYPQNNEWLENYRKETEEKIIKMKEEQNKKDILDKSELSEKQLDEVQAGKTIIDNDDELEL